MRSEVFSGLNLIDLLGFFPIYWWCYRKGDYYRYLAEFKSGNDRKEAAEQSLKAYQV